MHPAAKKFDWEGILRVIVHGIGLIISTMTFYKLVHDQLSQFNYVYTFERKSIAVSELRIFSLTVESVQKYIILSSTAINCPFEAEFVLEEK